MPFFGQARGPALSQIRPRVISGVEKMGLPRDAYYVLTKALASLPNSKLHPNSGAPNYNIAHNVSDLAGDTDDLTEGATNLYYTNARVETVGDTLYLKLDGSNANTNIDIGAYDFTTTGTGDFGGFKLGEGTTADYILTADVDGNGTWQAPAEVTIEGTAVLSTGEEGGTKFLREDGDGTCSWQTAGGVGDVTAAANLTDEKIVQGDGGAKGVKTSTATVAQIAANVAHAADNSQAHTDYLVNNANDTTSGKLNVGALEIDNAVIVPGYEDGRTIAAVKDGTIGISSYQYVTYSKTANTFNPMRGCDFGFQDQRTLTGNGLFPSIESRSMACAIGTYRDTNFTGTLGSYELYGFANNYVDTGNYDAITSMIGSDDVTCNYAGGIANVSFSPTVDIGAGNTITYNAGGMKVDLSQINPTMTSGIFVANYKAYSSTGTGTTTGTTTGYGFYTDLETFDTLYAFYNDTATADYALYSAGGDIDITDGDITTNGNLFIGVKSGATQGAAGAAANEVWKTAGHASLPNNVLMIGV